jgi:hypothetical protein
MMVPLSAAASAEPVALEEPSLRAAPSFIRTAPSVPPEPSGISSGVGSALIPSHAVITKMPATPAITMKSAPLISLCGFRMGRTLDNEIRYRSRYRQKRSVSVRLFSSRPDRGARLPFGTCSVACLPCDRIVPTGLLPAAPSAR